MPRIALRAGGLGASARCKRGKGDRQSVGECSAGQVRHKTSLDRSRLTTSNIVTRRVQRGDVLEGVDRLREASKTDEIEDVFGSAPARSLRSDQNVDIGN